MSEEVKEEVVEEAVEAEEIQMTPEEAVAGVETAAKTLIDMIAKASDALKSVAEVGDQGLDGLGADLQQAVQAIGVTVERVSGTAKEMVSVLMPQEAAGEAESEEAAGEAESVEEAAPAEEE